MNAQTIPATALTVVALQNEDILRSLLAEPAASPIAVAKATGRDPKNIGRQVELLRRDGLVGEGKPIELTQAGRRAVQAIDLANGATPAGEPAGDILLLAHHEMRPNPLQPRKHIDEEELEQLAASIHEADDVLQNLVVFPADGEGVHDLAAGERRWRAVGLLIQRGLWAPDRRLRALQRDRSAGQVSFIALVENKQRANLTLLEEARAYAELIAETGWSAREAALRTGRDVRSVQEMQKVLREADPVDISRHEQAPAEYTWEWLRNSVKEAKPAPPEPHQVDVEEAVAATYPDEPEGEEREQLLAKARAALVAYDAAVTAGRAEDATKAAEAYDEVVVALNGGDRFGSSASRDGRPSASEIVSRALAAPVGVAPMWGQAGLFMLDVSGMHVVVETTDFHDPSPHIPGGGANLHIQDLDAPFLSNTGYRSELGLRGPGSFVEAVTRKIVRQINQKGSTPGPVSAESRGYLADKIANRPELPLLQVPASWLIYDDPLVVNGVRFPNITRANQARMAAQGGAPYNGGKREAPEPKLAKPLDALEELALLELAQKLNRDPDNHHGSFTGWVWTPVRKYWLDKTCAQLVSDRGLVEISHSYPNGPHARITAAGDVILKDLIGEAGPSDAAIALVRLRAGLDHPEEGYSTPWLNVVDEPGAETAEPAPIAAPADLDEGDAEEAEALSVLHRVSADLDAQDDFDRPELFAATGIAFPLRAGEGAELGVIFDAAGQPVMTVDSDGALPEAAVRARVLLLMTTLNAVLAEWEPASDAPATPPRPEPAVPIRRSITPDYVVCLEDGRKFKSLTRHLRVRYNLSPDEYRARWGLPADYPMVAPNYAQARYELARALREERPFEDEADA